MTSQSQTRSAHAISNPTLAGIEKRWEEMPPQEQAELWMLLRDRMKVDWNEMTLQEKKAGVYFHCRRCVGESGAWRYHTAAVIASPISAMQFAIKALLNHTDNFQLGGLHSDLMDLELRIHRESGLRL